MCVRVFVFVSVCTRCATNVRMCTDTQPNITCNNNTARRAKAIFNMIWRRKVNRFNTHHPDYTRKAHNKICCSQDITHILRLNPLCKCITKAYHMTKCRFAVVALDDIERCGEDMAFDKIDRVYFRFYVCTVCAWVFDFMCVCVQFFFIRFSKS